uniref:Gastric inhibitory polypeptide receptor-like n=1 Tax=Stegastes partitus TaxID=144197 RepID=A0A3B5AGT2_9TELE
TTEEMLEDWNRYRNECQLKMRAEPRPKGVFCSRMFDSYACWSDGQPNSTVKVPCPWYLPWYDRGRNVCIVVQIYHPSIIYTPLNPHEVMYTVGYCASLASLSLALIILLFFSKLRCTRNYIHTNLFASFILRAASILTRDTLLSRNPPEFGDNRDTVSGCRVAQVLMQYCVGTNYFWLLVEGLYLHNLLVLVSFSENRYFCGYLLFGWGTPVLFVVPWIIVRYLFDNTSCWEINANLAHWWIIHIPIQLTIMVNFFFFIRIIHILVSKLKAHQMRYTDYKFRLAKSTLTLIPLLGIHEVVFAVLTEEHTEGVLHDINLFFQLFFNSFQVQSGFCTCPRVQAEIKRTWQRWKLGLTNLDDLRNTGSNTAQVGANPAACPKKKH